jgi:hypothetical protein
MSVIGKGLIALLFWLIVAVGFTEVTALALNAWILHVPHGQSADGFTAITPN